MGWLDNQVALVTGGGAGLGRAVASRFVAEGARVGVMDVDRDRLNAVDDALGGDVATIEGDVTSLADNERAVRETVESFGHLDVFVGNAGVFDDDATLPELPADSFEESFLEVFGVNVLGYLLGARAALPELVETEGRMVFTASQASFNPDGGGVLYVPSKHAIAGVIRQLAFELAPTVRVNGVAPGYVPTDLSDADSLGGETGVVPPEEFDSSVHPLDVTPTAADYAGAYVLLASPANSRPMTGTIVTADLGRSVRGISEVAGRALDFVTADVDE